MANKVRLIDANALMQAFREYMVERYDREKCVSEENCKTCDRQCLWWRKISEAPTVDAVEVVRCKDCVYYREEELVCIGVSCIGDSHANWYPDDFCSYGERKDSESS